MSRDPRAYLWDARAAADAIAEFTQSKALEAYLRDRMLRSAVERQFEIVGEALQQLSKTAPDVAAKIPDLRKAVGFRNLLIHGYATVDDEAVWRTVREDLPRLRQALTELLSQLGSA